MNSLLDFSIGIAEEAGSILLAHFKESAPSIRGTPKEVKSVFDRVSDEIIKKAIEEKYPDHSYLTEETGLVKKNSPYLWIIDPLDGTGNFVNGNPFFAVSIALWKDQKPLLCAIEAPALQEQYTVVLQEGAFLLNKKSMQKTKLKVSNTSDIRQAYLVYCEGGAKDKKPVLQTIEQNLLKAKDLRKLGSAALECAWVATGRADAYITHEISLWDIAAGVLLVHEAGGIITDFQGQMLPWEEIAISQTLNLIAKNATMSDL